jgi:D-alanyl-D-alanine carboxypeptidase/D-alanyl-D-alanine-endopeptidase (penicillin-binding protein 4)
MGEMGSRIRIVAALTGVLVFVSSSAASARPYWKKQIDRLTARRAISVVLNDDGNRLYARAPQVARVPASNQKLMTSMALLDELGPATRLPTTAVASSVQNGVVSGNLWIVGRGDPVVGGLGYGKSLPFKPTSLGRLARRIDAAGVTRITGRVVGSTTYFAHDWYAPGWKPDFPARYIALPSAVTFNGNVWSGHHIDDPERRAAHALTKRLRARGIKVYHRPRAGRAPKDTVLVARVWSQPLKTLVRYMNHKSSNFFAEVLGKRLGVEHFGASGTIAKGASAASAWAAQHGVTITSFDSSGLSYDNRISASGVARLLRVAELASWGSVLKQTLPAPGEGTLEDRLKGVRLRAKTGTLTAASTLSGYVWLRRSDTWAEMSILSGGMPKSKASEIENEIVRLITRLAR